MLGRFGEVKRRFTIGGDAHFSGVRFIVASDTEDPPNGDPLRSPAHRDGNHRRSWKDKVIHMGSIHMGSYGGQSGVVPGSDRGRTRVRVRSDKDARRIWRDLRGKTG